ncbi:hypothetical protein TCAL_06329 [Tigriopus californicus]|uniref:tRNA:m(4)X modification enzyme TRM13 n=2 Tax=Tigriopus californicus TaxID=6832 RepID=A0A553PAZ0_TIGCA|nr:hypothetical protein TCAL_06329 [Tigriopus californicus]
MLVKPGNSYCGEHANQEPCLPNDDSSNWAALRVPCPLDGKHTVLKSKLATHLTKCAAQPTKRPDYCQEGINIPQPRTETTIDKPLTIGGIEDERLMAVIGKVERVYVQTVHGKITTKILCHEALTEELTQSFYGPSVLKHLKQNASLLGLLEKSNLLQDDSIFVEFGSGRGLLTYWLTQAVPNANKCDFILVDRASHRHKFDNKLREKKEFSIERIRTDIQDLCLPNVPAIQSSDKGVVGVSKHLCGAATDLTLRACQQLEQGRLKGLMIALCCHHRCVWNLFAGCSYLQDLGFLAEEFSLLCGLTSWAICGSGKPRNTKDKEVNVSEGVSDLPDVNPFDCRYDRLELPRERREFIGLKVKRIFDIARANYVTKTLGLKAELFFYCHPDISPENLEKMKSVIFLAFFCGIALSLASVQPKPKDETVCSMCRLVMALLTDAISNPENEQDVIDFVYSLCPIVMPNNTVECEYMISTYGDDLLHFIVDMELSAEDICTTLTACP